MAIKIAPNITPPVQRLKIGSVNCAGLQSQRIPEKRATVTRMVTGMVGLMTFLMSSQAKPSRSATTEISPAEPPALAKRS